jgi:hypothetical protein
VLLRNRTHTPPRLKTVEQAEERGYQILMAAGALLALGLVLTITLVFAFIGVPLLIVGSLLAIGDLVWMVRTARRPIRELVCGDCEKPNRAFLDTGPFPCAECGAMLGEPAVSEETPAETEPAVREETPAETKPPARDEAPPAMAA